MQTEQSNSTTRVDCSPLACRSYVPRSCLKEARSNIRTATIVGALGTFDKSIAVVQQMSYERWLIMLCLINLFVSSLPMLPLSAERSPKQSFQ